MTFFSGTTKKPMSPLRSSWAAPRRTRTSWVPSNGLLNELYNANNPNTVCCQPCACTASRRMRTGHGGFAPSATLGAGDHNNFGPRLGFAWDVFGDGKTSLRGGFGVAYEGTLYNPLSNSRWNLPYYSFNGVAGGSNQPAGADVIYGPTTCTGGVCTARIQPSVPTFSGAGHESGEHGYSVTGPEPWQHRGLGSRQPEPGNPDRNYLSAGCSGSVCLQLLPRYPARNHAQDGNRYQVCGHRWT